MEEFVAYMRVSTQSQARSGLGLAAQRRAIEAFLGETGRIAAEFIEVQSGTRDNREELWKALAFAKKRRSRLLIARLDRFSRKVSFIAMIMDQGVRLVVAEMPNATDFQLHIFAALAQEERRMISARTKAALAEAKSRGVRLGQYSDVLARRNALQAKTSAELYRDKVIPLCHLPYSEIARELNRRGVRTPNGRTFQPQTVKNMLTYLRE